MSRNIGKILAHSVCWVTSYDKAQILIIVLQYIYIGIVCKVNLKFLAGLITYIQISLYKLILIHEYFWGFICISRCATYTIFSRYSKL